MALGLDSARADRRIALVVGNSKYQDQSLVLPNPGTDAADMAAALRKLQFEVVLIQDATVNQMDMALQRFAEAASGADTVLFYYAGHALQYQGNNFLMPVDASSDVVTATALNRSMVTDTQVREALDRSTGVKILVLDACRNNPYADRFKRAAYGATRAVENTRGLARIDKTQGSVIAYAAAPGDVASDGDGRTRNSPYTASLLRWIQEPAVEISTMFRRVTSDVYDTTKGKQQPEYTSTLRNDYFLDPIADQRIWERIRDSGDAAALREFIKQFPNSVRALDAQNRLQLLTDGNRLREEEARKQQMEREAERRRQEICRREGEEFATLNDDLAGLQANVRRWTCPQVVEGSNARVKEIVAQREAAAKAEAEARAREQERLVAERCRLDRERVEALANDLAQLQDLAKQPLCDPAKTFANERIRTVVAQRQADERKRAEAERICATDQKSLTAIWNDLTKLQVFKGTCDQVVATATERTKSLVAERERAQAALREQAERERLAALQLRAQREQAEREKREQAERAQREQTERERLAALQLREQREQAEREKREQAERAQREQTERERLAALQQREAAERLCASERNEVAANQDDLGKLKDLLTRVKCNEVKPSLNARVSTLDAAAKAEQARQQQAALKLAALEEEQNEIKRREEQRARTEGERQRLDLRCKSENEELSRIEADLGQLQEFMKRIGCDDVRTLATAKIKVMVHEEAVCKDEGKRLSFVADHAKGTNDRGRLIGFKNDAVKIEQDLKCARLRPSVTQELAIIRIKLVQVELKRLACYKGDIDGVLSDATREAVKLFLAKINRPDASDDVSDELLNQLGAGANASVCKPEPTVRPAVASRPPREPREDPPASRKPVVATPHRQEPREREPRQAAPVQHVAPPPLEPRPAVTNVARPAPAPSSSGGGVIGLH